MKRLIKHCLRVELWSVVLICLLYSCKKEDRLSSLATQDTEQSKKGKNANPKASEESADVVYQWYRFMTTLQRPVSPQPAVFVQIRAFAYIGIGLFESVQPGIKGGSSFSPKLYEMPAMPKPDMSKDYLWSASANAALASLFKLFLGSLSAPNRASIETKEAEIYNQLQSITSDEVLARSIAFGRSIATAIYNWSTTDRFSIASTGYTLVNEPWAWSQTPPNFVAPVGGDLGYSRPFLKYSLKATAPPIPIPYSDDPSSAFYKAAEEVYNLGGAATVTVANKATANWWADAGGVNMGNPAPYHILSIITNVLQSQNSGLWKAAEVYAKTGIAFKDGQIITFRSKYQYNLIRPITYIQREIDEKWTSYLVNPPYPEYTSGLMSFYSPVIEVLINEFGDIPVSDNAYAWRGLPDRQFNSLSQLRTEAALSRVYAGIHYRFTQEISIQMGIELGDQIDKVRVVGPTYQ